MTRTIVTVKKEIRILGLDACHHGNVAGAVVRGGLYLDGVILLPHQDIPRSIVNSKFFPELRAIMVHNPENGLDYKTIGQRTRLPTICVSSSKPLYGKYRVYRSTHGILWLRTSLPRVTLDRILALTWAEGRLPEPARIAHMLGQAQFSPLP